MDLILSQTNSANTLTTYFFTIHLRLVPPNVSFFQIFQLKYSISRFFHARCMSVHLVVVHLTISIIFHEKQKL
jgi:hypothetical protein